MIMNMMMIILILININSLFIYFLALRGCVVCVRWKCRQGEFMLVDFPLDVLIFKAFHNRFKQNNEIYDFLKFDTLQSLKTDHRLQHHGFYQPF